MTPDTRVLLADDHETVREGLRALFDSVPGVTVVGDVADGPAAVQAVCSLLPDLVVLDLSMPPTRGIDAIRQIRAVKEDTGVIVLSRYRDAAYVREAMAAGASGYVLKQSPFSELKQAVEDVARGGRHIDQSLSGSVPADPAATGTRPRLTEREQTVLRRAALGHSNKDIATALGIALKTVEVHKANAMRKLELRNRNEMVRWAALHGWLQDP
jgi:DNA-binding NarL/FixJ family response regulator